MTGYSSISLEELSQLVYEKRVAIIGLGNRNLGDDGLGPKLVQRLKGRVNALAYESHEGLEAVLSSIPADRPDLVVVVKAVDLGRKPGETILLSEDMLDKNGIGQHAREVRLLMRYIEKESGTPAVLLVVQPKDVGLSNRLSEEVYRSIKELESFFLSNLRRPENTTP
ncbi:MAG: hydrogenase maturation protease [Candidatus Glassbacteria bacterium]